MAIKMPKNAWSKIKTGAQNISDPTKNYNPVEHLKNLGVQQNPGDPTGSTKPVDASAAKPTPKNLNRATGEDVPLIRQADHDTDRLFQGKGPSPSGSGKGGGAGGGAFAIPDAPMRPGFNSQLSPTGTVRPELQAKNWSTPATFNDAAASAAPADARGGAFTAAVGKDAAQGVSGAALQQRATQVGNSPWLDLQLKQQGIEQENQINASTSLQAGLQAQGRSALSTKGGLSSGAGERLAKSGMQNSALQRQQILNQGQQSRLGLGIADENTKTSLLGTSANLEQGLSQFNAGQTNNMSQFNSTGAAQNSQFNAGQQNRREDFNAGQIQQNNQFNANGQYGASQFNAGQLNQADQFDISNAFGEQQSMRNDNLDYYREQMKDRSAGINANAIAQGGKGGGSMWGGK